LKIGKLGKKFKKKKKAVPNLTNIEGRGVAEGLAVFGCLCLPRLRTVWV